MITNLKLRCFNKFSVCVNTRLFIKNIEQKKDFSNSSMYFKQMEDFVKLSNKKGIL